MAKVPRRLLVPTLWEPVADSDGAEPGPLHAPAGKIARWLVRRTALAGAILIALLLLHSCAGPSSKDPAQSVPAAGDLIGFLVGMAGLTFALLLLASAVAFGVSHMQWRWSRVQSAIARRLRQPVHAVNVRVRWSPIRPWVPNRVVFRYPTSLVQSDPTPLLLGLFLTDFGIVVSVEWSPKSDRVVVRRVKQTAGASGVAPVEQSNQIVGGVLATLEPLLGGLRVDQERTEVDESGDLRRIVLTYDQTTKDTAPRFRARIQGIIESKVPSPTGAWTIRWAPHAHTVWVRPCEPLPEYVLNEGLPAGHTDLLSLPIGRGSGGHWLYWCPLKFPHFLISGATGGGKTAFIRTILVMALLSGWRVWIIDPKQTSFQFFADWPGVERVCTTGRQMRQAIFDHRDEMQQTYDGLRTGRITHDEIVPLLLIFDEVTEGFADIKEWVEENFADLKEENEHTTISRELKRGENALWRVSRKGRESLRIQLAGLQRPDTQFIPGEARDNLVSRAGCGFLKGDGLEMMFEDRSVVQRVTRRIIDSGTGEEREATVPGRMTVDVGHGPEPVQAAWTPDPAPGKHTAKEMELLHQLKEQVVDAQINTMRNRNRVVSGSPAETAATTEVTPGEANATAPETTVRARDIEAGQQIEIDTDHGRYAVEVVDVDVDDEEQMVCIDYCTLDDEGQAGSYEIDSDEHVRLLKPAPQRG